MLPFPRTNMYSSIFAAKHHLNLASYNFSKHQLGKGICDRKISVIKRALIQYIEDGNDIKSILDMNNALILIIT